MEKETMGKPLPERTLGLVPAVGDGRRMAAEKDLVPVGTTTDLPFCSADLPLDFNDPSSLTPNGLTA
jgi:hypothetical protein